jgi:aminoglycoside phosphotransferase (APT) family kinase protein
MQEFDGLLDTARLQSWIDDKIPGRGQQITVTRVQGGASNIIFKIERAGTVLALRRPPHVANDPTSNNMRREITLLEALKNTDVPHPRLVAPCLDPEVAGVPFAIMEWVDGFTPRNPLPPPFDTDPAVRRAMAFELIDALALISSLDWRQAGLESFGKPDGFLKRQVDRWLTQLGRYKTRDIAGLDRLADLLQTQIPATPQVSLIHGDYQWVNTMFHHGAPTRLAAVMDWEMATIGDPLLDLGWVLSGWQEPNDEEPSHLDIIDWQNFPARSELAERYAKRTGLPLDHIDYYQALSLFKLACIMEGAYYRYATGKSDHPTHRKMEYVVPSMIRRALRVLDKH